MLKIDKNALVHRSTDKWYFDILLFGRALQKLQNRLIIFIPDASVWFKNSLNISSNDWSMLIDRFGIHFMRPRILFNGQTWQTWPICVINRQTQIKTFLLEIVVLLGNHIIHTKAVDKNTLLFFYFFPQMHNA